MLRPYCYLIIKPLWVCCLTALAFLAMLDGNEWEGGLTLLMGT